jgi:hypothetical protein
MLFSVTYGNNDKVSSQKNLNSIKKEFSLSEIEFENFILENIENEFEGKIFSEFKIFEFSFINFDFSFQNLIKTLSFLKSTTTLYDLFCCLKIDFLSVL